MLRNYFNIAIRNLWRTKGFSFINITGLAVGMASAILIFLWIYNELSYDQFHKNKDYLYQAWNRGVFDGKLQCWNSTPKILGPTLKEEYPEVADVARGLSRWFVTIAGENKMSTKALVTDPAFLSMFTFPFVKGDEKTALNDVHSIVVTEKMAAKMFGREDAMNKEIRIDNDLFRVTGILKDLPVNTEFDFEYILSWAYLKKLGFDDTDWGNNSIRTYVQLKPNAGSPEVNEKIRDVTRKHSNGQQEYDVFLYPVSQLHLYSEFENGKVAGGRIETVRLFGIIAVFILLIACINFMNLSTARSEKRAKEVGIRKIAGADKWLLVTQFLGESVLLALISGAIALMLVQLFLPQFNILVGKVLEIPISNFYFWLSALLFIFITGIVAGSYPAFFLSSFKPVSVLKGTFRKAFTLINPRKVLVVLQFSFAIVLIISTFIVVQQIRYAQGRERGYEGDQFVYFWIAGELEKKYPALKSELLSSGVASFVTRTNGPLTSSYSDTWGLQWQGKDPNDKTDFNLFTADEGLIKTAGLTLIQGRDIDLTQYPSDSTAMLLNESAAKAMGFADPIGQIVKNNDYEYQVVGVIKDFILDSPYEHIKPMIIQGAKENWFNVINIRLTSTATVEEHLTSMRKLYEKYNPAYPFEYHFVDEDYARKFEDTQRIATISTLFTSLTIFISCLGLFGLASYMAEVRIKEIGIRKVLGASVMKITTLLSKDFLILVVISIIIASPIAWYAMHAWLQEYSYRVSIEWWVFAMSGLLCIIISLLTISFQAIKAALANPVKSLRTE
jgi:ABC-type antimicrobial peptide transport system permease subunit